MPNDPYAVAKIVIKFYQMMANFNTKALSKKYKEGVKFIQLPLIEDNQQNVFVNQQIKKKVEECLSMVEPGHQAKECESFIQLVQNLYKYNQVKEEEGEGRYKQLVEQLEDSLTKYGKME